MRLIPHADQMGYGLVLKYHVKVRFTSFREINNQPIARLTFIKVRPLYYTFTHLQRFQLIHPQLIPPFTCAVIHCSISELTSDYSTPALGDGSGSYPTVALFDQVVVVKCDNGYASTSGSSTSQCLADTKWSGERLVCKGWHQNKLISLFAQNKLISKKDIYNDIYFFYKYFYIKTILRSNLVMMQLQ